LQFGKPSGDVYGTERASRETTRRATEEAPPRNPPPAPQRVPMTAEYIESIRGGREIYLYGERIKDVMTHPAFRNSVRMTACFYDALHDPKTRNALTCPTDTGNGGYTMRFLRAAQPR
jgi:4-hydroxyphenylacetate 3-monooxygenase